MYVVLPELDYNGWGMGTFPNGMLFRKSKKIGYDSIFTFFVLQWLMEVYILHANAVTTTLYSSKFSCRPSQLTVALRHLLIVLKKQANKATLHTCINCLVDRSIWEYRIERPECRKDHRVTAHTGITDGNIGEQRYAELRVTNILHWGGGRDFCD